MKVFLSSTYVDLVEYRTKAFQAIERLGQHGVRMEVFGARPGEASSVCADEIDTSDIFVGLYAHRYGHTPAGSEVSITESEFDSARSKGKPCFCYVVDENQPWLPAHIETEPGRSRLRRFKEKIAASVVHDSFTTPDDLAFRLSSSLGRYLLSAKIKAELDSIPSAMRISTPQGRDQVARRAARLQEIVRGTRVLLVNDMPAQMRSVVAILRDLGVDVEIVTNTTAALNCLQQGGFEAMISDMRRGHNAEEGLRLLAEMRSRELHVPTIFTVGFYQPEKGTPPFAFGITNRVDELLHLLFDILERVRG